MCQRVASYYVAVEPGEVESLKLNGFPKGTVLYRWTQHATEFLEKNPGRVMLKIQVPVDAIFDYAVFHGFLITMNAHLSAIVLDESPALSLVC